MTRTSSLEELDIRAALCAHNMVDWEYMEICELDDFDQELPEYTKAEYSKGRFPVLFREYQLSFLRHRLTHL